MPALDETSSADAARVAASSMWAVIAVQTLLTSGCFYSALSAGGWASIGIAVYICPVANALLAAFAIIGLLIVRRRHPQLRVRRMAARVLGVGVLSVVVVFVGAILNDSGGC